MKPQKSERPQAALLALRRKVVRCRVGSWCLRRPPRSTLATQQRVYQTACTIFLKVAFAAYQCGLSRSRVSFDSMITRRYPCFLGAACCFSECRVGISHMVWRLARQMQNDRCGPRWSGHPQPGTQMCSEVYGERPRIQWSGRWCWGKVHPKRSLTFHKLCLRS